MMTKILAFLGVKFSPALKQSVQVILRGFLLGAITAGVLYLLMKLLQRFSIQFFVHTLLLLGLGILLYHFRGKIAKMGRVRNAMTLFLGAMLLPVIITPIVFLPGPLAFGNTRLYASVLGGSSFSLVLPFILFASVEGWLAVPPRWFAPLIFNDFSDTKNVQFIRNSQGIRWVFLSVLPGETQMREPFNVWSPPSLGKATISDLFKASLSYYNFQLAPSRPILFQGVAWSFKASSRSEDLLDYHQSLAANKLRFRSPQENQVNVPITSLPEGFKLVVIYLEAE